ncbi:cullin-associated NEDD8-dissociated protein 1 [Tanacetum coccineum]
MLMQLEVMKKTHYYLVDTSVVTPGAAVSELQFDIIHEKPFIVQDLKVQLHFFDTLEKLFKVVLTINPLLLYKCGMDVITAPWASALATFVTSGGLTQALALVKSTLLQGQALLALQNFFATMVYSTNTSFDALLESILSTAKPSPQSAGYRILAS